MGPEAAVRSMGASVTDNPVLFWLLVVLAILAVVFLIRRL